MTPLKPLTCWASLHGDRFAGQRALVTGGAGFIGHHLVGALLDLGVHVRVLDNFCNSSPAMLGPWQHRALEVVEGSILDSGAVTRAVEGCTLVFHLAALGSVPASLADPLNYHAVNATGTWQVIEAARTQQGCRLIFASSSSVYGPSATLPKVETMACDPVSPYAASKLAGEAALRAACACYAIDGVSLRYFNVFGPGQRDDSAYAAVIAAFARALRTGKAMTIFGDGTQSRDFTYVDNVVHANLLAARAEKPLAGQSINIACGQQITLRELATTMAQLAGQANVQPEFADPRPGDVPHSLADLTQATAVLNYQPQVDFAPGLARTWAWYEAQA